MFINGIKYFEEIVLEYSDGNMYSKITIGWSEKQKCI